MRKIVVSVVALVLLVSGGAFAQDEGGGAKIGYGIKAGINLAKFTGDDATGVDTKVGFAFGGLVNFAVSENMMIQPELLYVQKGTEESALGITAKFKNDYVQVPVLLRFNIPTQGSVAPALYVGPAISFNTSAKISAEGMGASASVDVDNVKSTDVGLILGAGLGFGSGESMTFFFDIRYDLGFSEVYEDVSLPVTGNNVVDETTGIAPKVKNGVISMMVGVSF